MRHKRTNNCPHTGPLAQRFFLNRKALALLLVAINLSACNTSPNSQDSTIDNTGSATDASAALPAKPAPDTTSLVWVNDGLLAPSAPALTVTARPGELHFSWSKTLPGTQVYLYQRVNQPATDNQSDTLLEVQPQSGDSSLLLEIDSHRLAWYQQHYRIEFCTTDSCVSSRRVSVLNLANDASEILKPTIALKAERFAEHVALNGNGTLLAVSAPLEGVVHLFSLHDNSWSMLDPILLDSLPVSSNRHLKLALSNSGDTLVIASLDPTNTTILDIIIAERLGESWFETERLTPVLANNDLQIDSLQLQLAADGDRLLLGVQHKATDSLLHYARTDVGWQLQDSIRMPDDHHRLPAFSASRSLNTVQTLSQTTDSMLVMHSWQWINSHWSMSGQLTVPMAQATNDVLMTSAADGSSVLIAAWESTSTTTQTPVIWRYQHLARPADQVGFNCAATEQTWLAVDSRRAPPVTNADAQLRLVSDARLDSVLFGWQSSDDALINVLFMDREHWRTALILPTTLNTHGKVPFAGSLALDASGNTAVIGMPADGNDSQSLQVGQVLILR